MDARLGIAVVLLWAANSFAQGFDHAHKAWDTLLKKHVVLLDGGKASRMDYAGIAQERARLKSYLDSLAAVGEGEFRTWSQPQQIAYLVNAYNAFTVEKILTRYPEIHSIWDFGKLFGNPFRDEFFFLLGRKASLDWVEHEVLRKNYREPRIHYAVNCASLGCPMLREEAYVAERLDSQLEEQARRFLSDHSRNRIAQGRLEVSKIFDWFKEDFEPRNRYFARYAALLAERPEERELVAQGRAPLSFLDYDWSLNDSRSLSRR